MPRLLFIFGSALIALFACMPTTTSDAVSDEEEFILTCSRVDPTEANAEIDCISRADCTWDTTNPDSPQCRATTCADHTLEADCGAFCIWVDEACQNLATYCGEQKTEDDCKPVGKCAWQNNTCQTIQISR